MKSDGPHLSLCRAFLRCIQLASISFAHLWQLQVRVHGGRPVEVGLKARAYIFL